ncbi:MAG: YkgJ family cysteine cluster protein [Desulfurococcaceae archaeon]
MDEVMISGKIVTRDDRSTRYKCIRCGKCCTSGPNVALTVFDICRIARFLRIDWRALTGRYIYAVIADHIPIPLLRGIGDKCVFLRYNNGKTPVCDIYPARPMRCRLFPFIPVSPTSRDRLEISSICPGIGKGDEEPPFNDLDIYIYEVSYHYRELFRLIFHENQDPMEALSQLLDSVCTLDHV